MLSLVPIPLPDLVVTSVTSKSSTYNVGDFIEASAKISNVGDFPTTGGFKVQWYLGNRSNSKLRLLQTDVVANVLKGVPAIDILLSPNRFIERDQANGPYFL